MIQDYAITIYIPNSNMRINLHKKGLEVLETNYNAQGTSMLTRLLYIAERIGTGTLKDIAAFSDDGKAIVDTYCNVYFPDEK